MQNHLIQILALVGMEPPVSLGAEDVRDEKVNQAPCLFQRCPYWRIFYLIYQVKLLRAVSTLTLKDLVIGQYIASSDKSKSSYSVRLGTPYSQRQAAHKNK